MSKVVSFANNAKVKAKLKRTAKQIQRQAYEDMRNALEELGVDLSDPATYEDFRTACYAFSDCAINYYTKLESQSEEYCTVHKM
jgi:hypothetical protein